MKRCVLPAALLLTAAVVAVVPAGPAGAVPDPVGRQSLLVEPGTGHDMTNPATAADSRTAPEIFTYGASGGPTFRYTCGPTAGLDTRNLIRWSSTTATDGTGWSAENILLAPTAGSLDAGGVCDPSLARIGNWYYLAYTGTSTTGQRQVFVARSSLPYYPFDKWNGTGWGGNSPAPIGQLPPAAGGQAGGPSLIVKNNTAYLYSNVRLGTGTYQTRLNTANLGASSTYDTWPQRLQLQPGAAIEHPGLYSGTDCVGNHWWADTDIAYDDTTGRFLALTSDQATFRYFALQAYESTDGSSFTKTTITRGDQQHGARTPALLTDQTGHIPAGGSTAIAYTRSDGCTGTLRYTPTSQRLLATGAINEPLTDGSSHWQFTGRWYDDGAGLISPSPLAGVSQANLTGSAAGTSTQIHVDVTSTASQRGWVGVRFGMVHPGDSTNQSGYTVYLERLSSDTNLQLCIDKAGFGTLSCRGISGLTWTEQRHGLNVFFSNGQILAYVDGASNQRVSSNDNWDPYLGGYVGLATYAAPAAFSNFLVADNFQPTLYGPRWVPGDLAGDWEGFGSIQFDLALAGELYVCEQDRSPAVFGDGTYVAYFDVDPQPGSDPQGWGGIVVSGGSSWTVAGYVVFMRVNGNLGIIRNGSGQVVADVPTGADPSHRTVKLRVLRVGGNFQVYVNDVTEPYINWTETNFSFGPGRFGIANAGVSATFSTMSWNGNQAH